MKEWFEILGIMLYSGSIFLVGTFLLIIGIMTIFLFCGWVVKVFDKIAIHFNLKDEDE